MSDPLQHANGDQETADRKEGAQEAWGLEARSEDISMPSDGEPPLEGKEGAEEPAPVVEPEEPPERPPELDLDQAGPDVAPQEEAAVETVSTEPVERPHLSRRGMWSIVGGLAALLVICVAAAFVIGQPYIVGRRALPVLWAGDFLLVSFQGPRGDDLYLLSPGQLKSEGKLLAQDVETTAASFVVVANERIEEDLGGVYGGFVPDKDWLLLWYERDGQGMLAQMGVRDEAPIEVLDSKGDVLSGVVFPDRQFVFVVESRADRSRCYLFGPGSEAQRIARADTCEISLDGSTLFLAEVYSDDLALSALRVEGGRERVLLDDVEGVSSYQISSDGSSVAYVQAEGGDEQLLLIDARSGAQQRVSDRVSEVVDYGFVRGGDTLFYVVQRDAGQDEVQLYLSTGDSVVAQGESITTRFTPDAKGIAYLVREGSSGTLHVDPLGEGERRVVLSQEGVVEYAFLGTVPSKIVVPIVQDGQVSVYTADLDGANVIQVLKTEGAALAAIQYVKGDKTLYLQIDDDVSKSLYVAPIDSSEAVRVLEGWDEIDLLNRGPSGNRLAFQGRQEPEGPLALYSVAVESGGGAILLDDVHAAFESAFFTRNGASILYMAQDPAGSDQTDICVVPADGGEAFEVMYEQAALVGVRWGAMQPFQTVE
jgi:Tol biopolymer transport system component